MLVYATTWFSMILMRLLSTQRSQSFIYSTLVIFLIVFAGLRWEVGCDWGNYLYQFEIVSLPEFSPWNMLKENGWWLLIDTIQAAGLPYFALNLVIAAIFFFCINAFALKQNDPVTFIIVLFPMLILGIVMAAARQTIAIGFVTLALMAFNNRKPLRMALWLFVAASFHSSALIFSPLFLIAWGRLSRLRVVFSLVLSIPIIATITPSEDFNYVSGSYLNTEVVARGVAIRLGSLLSTAIIFWFFLRKSWRINSPNDYSLAMIFFLGTLFLLPLIDQASVISDRLSYYLVPLQAMIIARAQTLPGIRNRELILVAQWLVLSVALIVWMSVSNLFNGCYSPYGNVIFL